MALQRNSDRRINRNIVECKVLCMRQPDSEKCRINRNIVECKEN